MPKSKFVTFLLIVLAIITLGLCIFTGYVLLKDGQILSTASGQTLKITKKNDKIWINDTAMLTGFEQDTINGILYQIDTVLMPK